MSQENVEIVRRALEAFNAGDVGGAIAYLTPEFEYAATGIIPGAGGVVRGPEGFRRFLESFWGEFDEPRTEVRDLIAAGDHVVVAQTFRGRGKQSGVETSWELWQVWTLRDGKAVHGRGFTSEAEALEAAGLPEESPALRPSAERFPPRRAAAPTQRRRAVPLWYRLLRPMRPGRPRRGRSGRGGRPRDAPTPEAARLGAERSRVQISPPRLLESPLGKRALGILTRRFHISSSISGQPPRSLDLPLPSG
jgi:ketosteroid isomerase-like protein